ncbi:hypothetical protein Peur_042205 [Populus x canadensis]
MQKVQRERWPKTVAMSSSSVLATVTTNVFVVGKCTTILSRLGPVGHRRGGKTAFALALDKADPVNGKDKGKQTPPPVLAYVPRSLGLDMAVMVIGSGLGELKRNPLFPSWFA